MCGKPCLYSRHSKYHPLQILEAANNRVSSQASKTLGNHQSQGGSLHLNEAPGEPLEALGLRS